MVGGIIVDKLKPCLVCGCRNTVAIESSVMKLLTNRFLYWASCSRCGRETRVHYNKINAIKEWNRRNTNG